MGGGFEGDQLESVIVSASSASRRTIARSPADRVAVGGLTGRICCLPRFTLGEASRPKGRFLVHLLSDNVA